LPASGARGAGWIHLGAEGYVARSRRKPGEGGARTVKSLNLKAKAVSRPPDKVS
jgi:hypothetical protein